MLRDRPAERSGRDTYVYDPLDLRPAELEREPIAKYLTDDRVVRNLAGDGLVYDGEPFGSATEVCGIPQFVAWMALDVPDTDFVVTLYEVRPDGSSLLLTEDRMRARYRESLRTEKLATPGKIERYTFSTFPFVARRLASGSRLRVVLRSPNSIFWEKNYNSGGVVAAESGADARRATVTLYHDREHQSALEVPICR